MRLRRIELENFKRLVDFTAEFSPGINVVKGPLNEMGKSTLLEGIITALFHNPKSTAKWLKDYVSWGATHHCRTSLEFMTEEDRYLLEKDFDKGTVKLINENTQEEFDTFKEISERIAELLGTNSDRLFSCTSCIRQTEVRAVASGRKEISESLEEVVTGGEESTRASQVIQKLDDKISEMKKGLDRPAKVKGILASLKDQQDECLRKYNGVRSEVSKVEAQKIELVAVNKQFAAVKEEYEKSKALLDKNRQRKEIEASIKDLEQKYDEVDDVLRRADELMTNLDRANAAITSIEGVESEQQVLEFRKKLDAIQSNRASIQKDLAERETELAEAKGAMDRKGLGRFLASHGGMVIALAMLIGGIIGALAASPYLSSLVIVGVVLLVIGIRARIAIVRDKTRISGIEQRIQRMNEALVGLDENQKSLLVEIQCSTPAEFDKKERDFGFWLKEKGSLEARLRGLLRDRTIEDFRRQRREIARELAVKKAALTEDLIETRLGPGEYVELERKVQSLQAKHDELDRHKRRCEVIIEQARFNIEDQIELEEEMEALQGQLKREKRKLRVYELARDFVSQARMEVLSSAEEALEKEIARLLAVFTNGKYRQVKVDKDALEFWAYSDEKGDWARPEELSGGVIDEFYLAFRLALAKLIFGDKKPPLILDDPFVNFDSVRLGNTLNFLRTLASDYQVIIFTLSDLYDGVADNIILLGEK